VSFVGEQNILHWNAALLQATYNLLGFDDWYVRIIGAMQYDCSCFHLIYLMHGRKSSEQIRLSLRIAVFHGGDRSHPRFGIGKESLKVDYAKKVRTSLE